MTPLATDPTPDWAPRWSPDGNEIAFYSYRSGNRDIWVMPSRGGPARQLTSDPGHDYYPSWSPDGRVIAYESRGKASIALMDAKGGDSRSLGPGVLAPFEWSRDGRSLLFQRNGHLFRVSETGAHRPRSRSVRMAASRTQFVCRAMVNQFITASSQDHERSTISGNSP